MDVTLPTKALLGYLPRNPKLYWGFMGYRNELFRYAKPHAGYDLLKRIVNFPGLKDYFIVTENVDGMI